MDLPKHTTLIPLFKQLRGPQVVARPYGVDDADEVFAAIEESREHLWPWLPWGAQHQSVEDTRDFLLRSQAAWLLREGDLHVGIFAASSGRFLGGAALHVHGWNVPAFEIGYWLRSSAQGHGYVSETVRLLTDFAFESLGAQRVMIRCDARNIRSAAVAERLGFMREGRLRHDARDATGALRDTLVFSLVPSDPRLNPLTATDLARVFAQLRTDRLDLRRPTAADRDALFQVLGDAETHRYNPSFPDLAITDETLQRWLQRWEEDGYGYWVVVAPPQTTVIGFGGVLRVTWRARTVLNLYYQFRPEVWGRGYALELARTAVSLAHSALPHLPVMARVRPNNRASARIAEEAGLLRRADLDRDDLKTFTLGWGPAL
jgi:ribosomal-protein-serine acetyltransferase